MTIYRSALINRRPGLTETQFREHWIRVHGAIAAGLPGVGTYRQNHIAERFFEDAMAPVQSIDGISQLAFDDIGAMERSDASDQYALAKADIPLFQGGITILVLKADQVVEAPPPRVVQAEGGERRSAGAKLVWLSARRPEVPAGDLRGRWLQEVGRAPARLPGAGRWVQNFVIDRSHPVQAGVPAGDAAYVETMSEMWFDDAQALRAALATPAGHAMVHADPLLAPFAVYRIEEVHIIEA
jgi:uncharacterized protein (TIGR02118 family)